MIDNMNTGNYTICLLFIIFFVSATQKTTAQESELSETMRRWLREQNERTIEPDFRLLQQQQQFPLIQQQQDVLRVSPTTRLPTYLDRLQIADSTELILLRNMFDNLCREHMSRLTIPPFNSPHFVPDRIGIRNTVDIMSIGSRGLVISGDFCVMRAIERRRHRRHQEQLDRLGIEWRQERWGMKEIYELIEKTNQLIREAKEEGWTPENSDN